jgi:hypothetical protein
MRKCDALHQDGCKLGRPHEVDGFERMDCRCSAAPKVALRMTKGGPPMEEFIHQQNLALFKKRLAEPHTDAEREMLMKLLTEEQAKEPSPKQGLCQSR